jgi:hypothetical protein
MYEVEVSLVNTTIYLFNLQLPKKVPCKLIYVLLVPFSLVTVYNVLSFTAVILIL